ncbi:unnamed protein product, partial [Mesorhabditis belari]|uniref:Major facilitator superfamily (MFS) profile domain-containing protein n=1 Tax=Mesorhabditis belari TaxID=2138241 RepID=A0AAF3F7Z9_9BILA
MMNDNRKSPSRRGIMFFVALMVFIIGIQGTYLGYVVGVLTTLEKRFGFTSEKTGFLLSSYDLGHTIAILLAGYFGSKGHLPRITGAGVFLSGLSMLLLVLPAAIFQLSESESEKDLKLERYSRNFKCNADRYESSETQNCEDEHEEHLWAFILLLIGQFFAGVFAAPFNTLAYVYIDNNVEDRRQSPFLLGLLTSMYAFGPALGFGLSALTTRIYTTLDEAPHHISKYSTDWIGAWWAGFLVCGFLYLVSGCAISLPKILQFTRGCRNASLKHPHLPPGTITDEPKTSWTELVEKCREFPYVVLDLCKNPVFTSMVVGWTFGKNFNSTTGFQ